MGWRSSYWAGMNANMPFRMLGYAGVPILLLTAWCAISTLWSVNPDVTLRRSVAMCGVVVLGTWLGLRFGLRDMLRLLLIVALPILVGSFLLAAALPDLGLDAEGRLRGVTAHKNALGAFASLSLLVSVALLLGGEAAGRLRATAWLTILLALGCMAAARSTAVLPVLLAALTALVMSRGIRAAGVRTLALIPLGVSAGVLVFAVAAANSGALAELLGKDSDMSGRTMVWDYAMLMIAKRPWLGFGFSAFWVGSNSPGAVFWANTRLGVPHAHNGYVQLILDAGLVALAMFLGVVGIHAARLLWLLRHGKDRLLPFAGGFLGFYLVYNLSETLMWVGNEMLPLVFVYLVVRTNIAIRQARARRPGPTWHGQRPHPVISGLAATPMHTVPAAGDRS